MKRTGRFWQRDVFNLVILGSALFIVLTLIAMFTFPGGTRVDPGVRGYSFFRNFFSELGFLHTRSGTPNTASAALFFTGLFAAGGGLVLFCMAFPQFFTNTKTARVFSLLGSFFGILAGLCFIGVAFTPADIRSGWHIIFVLWAFRLFPAAVFLLCLRYLFSARLLQTLCLYAGWFWHAPGGLYPSPGEGTETIHFERAGHPGHRAEDHCLRLHLQHSDPGAGGKAGGSHSGEDCQGGGMRKVIFLLVSISGVVWVAAFAFHSPGESQDSSFTFGVLTDMRSFTGSGQYDTTQYFRGAVQALSDAGGAAFILSPGDIDPPSRAFWTITQTLGIDARWYPGVGNHELPDAGSEPVSGANMTWLREFDYGSVNPGPSGCPTTTFSWDYHNAHFVMLNEYCDSSGDTVTEGDIPDHLYNWLVNDLDSTDQPFKFVIGHEPAYPQPDADNDRLRHLGDSLDQFPDHCNRFWDFLRAEGVLAYLCGHTHNYSLVRINGVWQVDAGHSRGLGDTGASSTVVLIHVHSDIVAVDVYRDDAMGGAYQLEHRGYLVPRVVLNLPAIFLLNR